MMKKLFLVLAMVASACAWAESEVVDGVTWYYWTSVEWDSAAQKYVTYARITSGAVQYKGDLVVPSTLGGYKVKQIGDGAFSGCSSLESVTIPEGVTSIGGCAFEGCSSLERFDVPASVTSMGKRVIRRCDSLTVITVAEGNANYKSVNNCIVSSSGTTLVAVPFGCEKVDIPVGVTSIDSYAFEGCSSLKSVTIPEGVTRIEGACFIGCSSLDYIEFPASLTSFAPYTGNSLSSSEYPGRQFYDFYNMPALKGVKFRGPPPSGFENAYFSCDASVLIEYPREYGAAWMAVINDVGKFRGYNRERPEVTVVSSRIRANDPTILDVVYKVTSSQPTVKVRALALEDGVRSFANVVRPETFVADANGVETAGNVGDAIAANVEHTLSWRVASDWSNRLAKVTFEVLASEGDLLPLEVRTIPASEQYGKMDVTWNAISESQWYDALMWLYADKNKNVTITDGKYFYDGKIVANGTTMYYNKSAGSYYSRTYDSTAKQYVYVYYKNVQEVVLGEMGYTLLTGDVLNYVNDETRLGLSPSGYRQYGYRIVGE